MLRFSLRCNCSYTPALATFQRNIMILDDLNNGPSLADCPGNHGQSKQLRTVCSAPYESITCTADQFDLWAIHFILSNMENMPNTAKIA